MPTDRRIGRDQILGVFTDRASPHTPLTTAEVADAVDGPVRSVYEVLDQLADDEILHQKSVGEDGQIWWIPTTGEWASASWRIEPELITEQVREIEFQSELVAELLRPAGGSDFLATVDGIVPLDGGGQLEYWVVRGTDPAAFVETLTEFPTFVDVRLLSTTGDTYRFEIEVTAHSLMSIFLDFHGRLIRAAIDNEQLTMVGQFPLTADITDILDAATEPVPDLQIVSQRLVLTPRLFQHLVKNNLTKRQWTSLQVAYYSGYFAIPRQRTGEEIAVQLDVTRQTFHYHLRHAVATICQCLFEGLEPDLAPGSYE